MQTNWLAASSFEEALKLVEAINNLSTDAKLNLAGIDNPTPQDRIEESREFLIEFVKRFQDVVRTTETDEGSPILGTDPRSGELVRRYLAIKKSHLDPSGLYGIPLDRLLELLTSDHEVDLKVLVECLSDLRDLVEEHSQTDVNNILGKL
jgi:hypothetical protein